jgi:hypothetical protein
MPSTDYQHTDGDGYVTELVDTRNQVAKKYGHLPYRKLAVTTSDGSVATGGSDSETVTVEVISQLDYLNNDRETTLAYGGDMTVRIDGEAVTKTLSGGSVEFTITTEKAAGETIEIVAESLAEHPAESDSTTVEVIQA